MQPHPLINFEIQKYYQNQPNFNGVYSRKNLSKIKKNLEYHTSSKKHQFFLLLAVKVKTKMKKIFKEEESIEILKILGLIKKYVATLKIWLKKT